MSSNTSTTATPRKKTVKKTTPKESAKQPTFTPSCMSLFSGLGGDSLGMQNAGGKMVAYNELNPLFCQSHDLNFPECQRIDENGITDITKIPDATFLQYANTVDILFAGFPCFVAGTPVLTRRGYVPIERVSLEDTLLTHNHAFQKIINIQTKKYNGTSFHIRIKHHANNITCTSEHPFFVRNKTSVWDASIKRNVSSFSTPTWKPASQLTLNDYFGMVINQECTIPQFVFHQKTNAYAAVDKNIILNNNDQWFLLGYFVGNGWIEDTKKPNGRPMHKIRFAIARKDEEYICSRISTILPITDKKSSDGACKKYGCSNFVWYHVFQMFGKYAHGKFIPEWVQDAPIHFIESFLEGYLAADGCIQNNDVVSYTTVSYSLALGIQRLYLKLGHIFSIHKTVRPRETTIQGQVVCHHNTYCVSGILDKKRPCSSFIEDGYVWYAPSTILQDVLEDTCVYNFEVEHDNSYIVENCVVHNCQGFSNAGKKMDDDPRNTLFREFLRVTRLVKPSLIIGENVKGLLSRKTTSGEPYIDVIVSEFQQLGYSIQYKVLRADDYGVPQKRERLIIVGTLPNEEKQIHWKPSFPEPTLDNPNLRNIVRYDMSSTLKVDDALFEGIPEDCILTNMDDHETYQDNNGAHPYLVSKVFASGDGLSYGGKTHDHLFSFGKRISPIHCEIVDIRQCCKTVICSYDHQPRFFVPIRNPSGSFLRVLLPDELKQIQGFPADYQIVGNWKQQVTQIGNAVPSPLIQHVVQHILNGGADTDADDNTKET